MKKRKEFDRKFKDNIILENYLKKFMRLKIEEIKIKQRIYFSLSKYLDLDTKELIEIYENNFGELLDNSYLGLGLSRFDITPYILKLFKEEIRHYLESILGIYCKK